MLNDTSFHRDSGRAVRDYVSGLRAGGLALDRSEEYIESFIFRHGLLQFMEYASTYSVRNSRGLTVFAEDATFTRVKKDILFDEDLRELISPALGELRVGLQNRLYAIFPVWADSAGWDGVISDSGNSYDSPSSRSVPTLEEMSHDFDMYIPLEVCRIISGEYGMESRDFSLWLDRFALLEAFVNEKRRLLDHIFSDSIPLPPYLRKKVKGWKEGSGRSVGGSLAALDHVCAMGGCGDPVLPRFSALLSEHSVKKERVGL